MINRNKKGQFIKGHSLGVRFKNGHKLNVGKKRLDMIGNKWAEGTKPLTVFKKGCTSWNKGRPNTWSNGDKSNLWKGGVSKKNRTERTNFMGTLEYVVWRRGVFERDNFTCQICGDRGGKLRANHIKKYVDYPKLRTKINNGITLCKSCDIRWVLRNEEKWESYFNFNLLTRGTDTYDGYVVGQNI